MSLNVYAGTDKGVHKYIYAENRWEPFGLQDQTILKVGIINHVLYAVNGKKLTLNVGFSHSVEVEAVAGIKIEVSKPNQIDISGISKELVGRFASNIRDIKPVEPYHAYGIRYLDEVVVRKEGKTAKK